MEFSTMTRQDKIDVFDCVNGTFLNLKGERRKVFRTQFCNVWKQNKNIGAADLVMALFNSIDKQDSWERSLREDVHKGLGYSEKDIMEKMMPFLTYKKIINGVREDMDEMAQKIEDLEEDSITQDDHKTEMKEAVREQKDKHEEEMLDLERKHKSEILALKRKVSSAEASEANAVKMYEMASKCANMKDD
jgi:hypothetical protein